MRAFPFRGSFLKMTFGDDIDLVDNYERAKEWLTKELGIVEHKADELLDDVFPQYGTAKKALAKIEEEYEEIKDYFVGDKRKHEESLVDEHGADEEQRTPEQKKQKIAQIEISPQQQKSKKTKSFSNSPDSAQDEEMVHRRFGPVSLQEAVGKVNDATDGTEVQVMPPPAKIAKVIPNYFTVELPWVQTETLQVAAAVPSGVWTYRLNSIFDPAVTTTGHQPLGRDNYSSLFKYYRVLAADVRLTWYNSHSIHANTPSTAQSLTYWLNVGYAPVEDSAATSLPTKVRTFQETKHTKYDIISPEGFAGPSMVSQSFHYEPAKWDYHVQEANTEERWTPFAENPTNPHFLALFMGSLTNGTTGTLVSVKCHVNIKYTVQFREIEPAILNAEN